MSDCNYRAPDLTMLYIMVFIAMIASCGNEDKLNHLQKQINEIHPSVEYDSP